MPLEHVESFSVALTADEDGNVVVGVQGKIDLATADQLWAALIESLSSWTGEVVLYLAGVNFLALYEVKRRGRDTVCHYQALDQLYDVGVAV